MKLLLSVLLLTLSLQTLAGEQPWICHKDGKMAVRASIGSSVIPPPGVEDKGLLRWGEIEVAGVIHKTLYKVQGFNREWHWSQGDSQYSFVIMPDAIGLYYDFTNEGETKVSPTMTFKCQQEMTKENKEKWEKRMFEIRKKYGSKK